MIHIYIIISLAVSISVKLHPFPHLISWERTVSLNNIDNPKYHAAIPNGSRKREVIGPLFYFILNSILLAKRTFSSIENALFSNRKHRFRGM